MMDLRSKFKSLRKLTFAKSRNTLVLLYFSQLFIREGGQEGEREEESKEGKEGGRDGGSEGDIVGSVLNWH